MPSTHKDYISEPSGTQFKSYERTNSPCDCRFFLFRPQRILRKTKGYTFRYILFDWCGRRVSEGKTAGTVFREAPEGNKELQE